MRFCVVRRAVGRAVVGLRLPKFIRNGEPRQCVVFILLSYSGENGILEVALVDRFPPHLGQRHPFTLREAV